MYKTGSCTERTLFMISSAPLESQRVESWQQPPPRTTYSLTVDDITPHRELQGILRVFYCAIAVLFKCPRHLVGRAMSRSVTLVKGKNNMIGISIGGGAPFCPVLYVVQVRRHHDTSGTLLLPLSLSISSPSHCRCSIGLQPMRMGPCVRETS